MRKPFSLEASATPSSKPASTPANLSFRTASILFLALALVLPVQSRAKDSTALNAQTQAYITLVYADEARELEKWKEAGTHYQKALKEYKQIQSAHPDFNSEIISYRIAYCKNHLNGIVHKLKPISPPEPNAELYESKYKAAKQENAYLHSRLEELEEELDQTGDSTDLQKEIERLQLELSQVKSGQNNTEATLLQDVERTRKEAEHFRAEVDRQKTVLADLKVIAAEREQDGDRIRELTSEIKTLKSTHQQLTERLKKSEQAATKKKQSEAATSAMQEAAVQEMRSQLKNEQNINRQLITQVKAADQRVRELSETNDKQSKELNQFGQQISTLLGREQDSALTLAEQKKELEARLKEHQAVQKALKRATDDLKKAEAQMEGLKTAAAQGATQAKDLEQKNTALLAELQELKDTGKFRLAKADNLAAARAEEIKNLSQAVQEAAKRGADDLKKAETRMEGLKTAAAQGATQARNLAQHNTALLAELQELKDTGKFRLAEADNLAAARAEEIKNLSKELNALREARIADQAAEAKSADNLNSELQALSSRNAQIQAEVETLTQAKNGLSAKTVEFERQLGDSRKELEDSRDTAARLEAELASLLLNLQPLQKENEQLKKDLKDSLTALDSVQVAMQNTISSRSRPVQEEADRLMEEVAELKSYQESVGSITPKQLARLREDLATLKGLPPPTEPHAKEPTEQTPPLDTMLREGQAREREGNLEEASALYNRILEVAPGQTDAANSLSRIYLQKGQPEKADALLKKVLKENRDNAEALFLLGLTQYTMDDYREATSTLKKLVKKHGDNSRGWNALGASFMAQEKFRDARESFERAISLEANLGDAHYNLAQVLRIDSPKEKDLIRQHYETAISLGSRADGEMDLFLKAQ